MLQLEKVVWRCGGAVTVSPQAAREQGALPWKTTSQCASPRSERSAAACAHQERCARKKNCYNIPSYQKGAPNSVNNVAAGLLTS